MANNIVSYLSLYDYGGNWEFFVRTIIPFFYRRGEDDSLYSLSRSPDGKIFLNNQVNRIVRGFFVQGVISLWLFLKVSGSTL